MAMAVLEGFIRTGQVVNCVNLAEPTSVQAAANLVVRHLDKVGVLAGVLDRLRDEGINIEQMENKIFRGARAAVCYLTLSKAPSDATLKELNANADIIRAAVVEA
jgi:D-3-phosphoglycerate dehydrogenase